jgi:hypothetical protein
MIRTLSCGRRTTVLAPKDQISHRLRAGRRRVTNIPGRSPGQGRNGFCLRTLIFGTPPAADVIVFPKEGVVSHRSWSSEPSYSRDTFDRMVVDLGPEMLAVQLMPTAIITIAKVLRSSFKRWSLSSDKYIDRISSSCFDDT